MNEPLRWVTEPLYARLFYLYLIFLCCIALMYALRLARRLFSTPGRRPVSWEHIHDGDVEAEAIAKAALGNRIACEPGRNKIAPSRSNGESAAKVMRSAEMTFVILWEKSQADTTWLRRMARLTLLLSFIVVAQTAFSTWVTEMTDNSTGLTALFGALSLLLQRLEIGLVVSAILFGLSSCYERSLAHRWATWKYLSARFRSGWTDN